MANKTILLGLLCILLGFSTEAQSFTFKTQGFSVAQKNEKSKHFDKWSKFIPTELIIVFDPEKERVVVYSQEVQLFQIVEFLPAKETETDLTYSFPCLDTNQQECNVSIITRKNQGNRKQLYIYYPTKIIAYNIENYKK